MGEGAFIQLHFIELQGCFIHIHHPSRSILDWNLGRVLAETDGFHLCPVGKLLRCGGADITIHDMKGRIYLVGGSHLQIHGPKADDRNDKNQDRSQENGDACHNVSSLILPQVGERGSVYCIHWLTTLPSSMTRILSAIWAMVSS